MLIHPSTGAEARAPCGTVPEVSGGRRAALYLSSVEGGKQSPALLDCARQAQQQGLRVVTVVAEEERATARELQGPGLGGKRLRALVGRLGDGQFDIIVAHTGDAMITIGVPAPIRQSEAG